MKTRLILFVCLCCFGGAEANPFYVKSEFLELRTGPGNGYPVFYVSERGQAVALVKRRNDWLQVMGSTGARGWVRDDYFADATNARLDREDSTRRLLALGVGWFGGDSIYSASIGYRVKPWLIPNVRYSKSVGDYSSSDIVQVGLTSELFRFARISPYIGAHYGYFRNTPRLTLVGRTITSTALLSLGGGFGFELFRRISLRTGVSSNILQEQVQGQSSYFAWQTSVNYHF